MASEAIDLTLDSADVPPLSLRARRKAHLTQSAKCKPGGSSGPQRAFLDLTGDSQDDRDDDDDDCSALPQARGRATGSSSSSASGGPSTSASGGPSASAADHGSLVIDLSMDDADGAATDDPPVIDLDGDDASIARSLQASLRQAPDSDLATLQAAREQRRKARQERMRMRANAIDVEAEPDDLLFQQRVQISDLVRRSAPKPPIPGAPLHPNWARGLAAGHRPTVQLEVWPNPKSLPGCQLYERFVAAWSKVPDKNLRLVFHGTGEANIDAICRDGLDPRRRAGQAHGAGEYFGGNMDVSLAYCRGGRYMLVFAVLLDKSGVTKVVGPASGVPGEIVVINKPEHQLPLAVVSLGCQRWAPAASWATSQANLYTSADVPAPAHKPLLGGLPGYPGGYPAYAAAMLANATAMLAARARASPKRATKGKSRKRGR